MRTFFPIPSLREVLYREGIGFLVRYHPLQRVCHGFCLQTRPFLHADDRPLIVRLADLRFLPFVHCWHYARYCCPLCGLVRPLERTIVR